MSLPPTVLNTPNAVVQPYPGMNIQPICLIIPPPGAFLTTALGGAGNVSVNVQPGMNVRAAVIVSSSGKFTS